jgi:hypothetical protein
MTFSVLAECRQIERTLSEFPSFITEMMYPQLTRKFAEMIWGYKSAYFCSDPRLEDIERANSLCIAMFRSVLTPYVYKDDDVC